MTPSKRWIFNGAPATDAADDPRLADQLGVSPFLVRLLRSRGMASALEMDVFLSPNLRHLAPPESYPGLMQAAQALADGLAEGRTLCVWGDYDVDGVTSTALVLDFLGKRGIAARHHIPDRVSEGYGLNVANVERLAKEGVGLLLTVDCGIAATAEVARARELGMIVVVSDHHLPPEILPDAHAVCDPRLADCPCPDLAGVGVAFLLMAALNRLLPGTPADMREFLDLVALGTLADIVELTPQNRILVKNGLLMLKDAQRPGIHALKEAAGFNPVAPLNAGQVVFGLAPRINAAGRIGQAGDALALLLAKTRAEARPLAQKLDDLNRERRGEEDAIFEAACAQADTLQHRPGLVVAADDWHPGVVGIVASRLVERHHKPTLVLTREGADFKGSGRSTEDFDLFAGLTACAGHLSHFGGHRQAAGLRVAADRLDALRDAFDAAVQAQLGKAPEAPRLCLDSILPFADISHTLLRELELLEPFGPGNPEPVFCSERVQVEGYNLFGKDRAHVKLLLREPDSGVAMQAKAWRMAKSLSRTLAGKTVRAAFQPRIDTYSGVPTIELTLRDVRPD